MKSCELAHNWHEVAAGGAVQSQLRAAGSAPTQGGGVG
jgi:hypothetical protein